ncbi:hypothetical protein [Thiocapsa rosea]|uniref:hypothetical protein n=1 Tax=Thiocapsa rosea TaxID=69360 RepID=UPI0011C35210|nr:hypothetical protein [Thiocapsa rosea]
MIEEISLVLGAAKSLLGLAKETKDLLPDSKSKEEIERAIAKAEKDLAIAESSTAQELGFDLCKCTFPPQIMLYDNSSGNNVCPRCHNTTMAKPRIYID